MNLIAVSQRIDVSVPHGERRDALDQRWCVFLAACNLTPLIVPNHPECALTLVRNVPVRGVVLTGGHDLMAYGGSTPERDRTETLLLEHALRTQLPLLGVCRGMQLIQHHFGVPLKRVEGHVTPNQTITANNKLIKVNSYHHYGAHTTVDALMVWATAEDGVIKGILHRHCPLLGIMWHPERMATPMHSDVRLFTKHFTSRKRQ